MKERELMNAIAAGLVFLASADLELTLDVRTFLSWQAPRILDSPCGNGYLEVHAAHDG
jgi:hypothetical protein